MIANTAKSVVTIFLISCGLVAAQETPDRGDKPPKKNRERSCLRSDGTLDIRRATKCLTEELSLDTDQSASLKSAMDDYRKKSSELRGQYRPPDEMINRLKTIREEITVARESKDEAAMDSLIGELRSIRAAEEARKAPMIEGLNSMHQELLGTLKTGLRSDQVTKLNSLWSNRIVAPREVRVGFRGQKRSAQALKAMVDRLPGRTKDQEQQLEGLFRGHMEAVRAAGSSEAEREKLVGKLYDDVMAALTPAQQARIEKDMRRGQKDVNIPDDTEKEKPDSPKPEQPSE